MLIEESNISNKGIENNQFQQNNQLQQNNQTKNDKKTSLIIGIAIGVPLAIIILINIIAFTHGFVSAINNAIENSNYNNSSSSDYEDTTTTDDNGNKYKLNSAFTFDDLEITIKDEYSFDTINNKYSENYGQTVVKIPITIKNLKNETHSLNLFYISFFGSQGAETDSIWFYFDDAVENAGDLRTGASYTKYLYLLYDGDGTYTVEFDNWTEKIDIDIDVKK
jgi:hypothetical protein